MRGTYCAEDPFISAYLSQLDNPERLQARKNRELLMADLFHPGFSADQQRYPGDFIVTMLKYQLGIS